MHISMVSYIQYELCIQEEFMINKVLHTINSKYEIHIYEFTLGLT